MNWQAAQDPYSITDYLANEQVSECKHEYLDGQIYAMAGASINHQRIIANLMRLFGNQLRNTPCEPLASDTKVKIGDLAVFYPDVIVVCEPETSNDYYTEQPLIIVEVLSKSTRRIDETTKRRLYQTLPSLQEYVLIEQDIVDIEICRRSQGWQPEHYFMGDEINFAAIDLTVSVNEIYERVVNEDVKTFFDNIANNLS
jgi:Uma2 family endonuclease